MSRPYSVLVTNIPTPYRDPVHRRVFEALQGNYHVIYCQQREANRLWDIPEGAYERTFLKPRVLTWRGRYIHANPDVWRTLTRLDPDVVITAGFGPTALLAFLWTRRHRRRHIPITEGTLHAEAALTPAHRWVRRRVFRRSAAFLAVSVHTEALYRHYGCAPERIFRTCYSIDNARYAAIAEAPKTHELLFSGQLIERKQPLFFAAVAAAVRRARGVCRVTVLGDGPLRQPLLDALHRADVTVDYPGFVQQDALPGYFGRSRLFLFPTLADTWGIVANEACAAGVPVITCANAGSAGDLVLDGVNGRILPLDVDAWTRATLELLDDAGAHAALARGARERVRAFTHEAAAQGIVAAIERART